MLAKGQAVSMVNASYVCTMVEMNRESKLHILKAVSHVSEQVARRM